MAFLSGTDVCAQATPLIAFLKGDPIPCQPRTHTARLVQVKQVHMAMVTGSKILVLINNFVFHIQLIEPAAPILGNVLSVERSISLKTPVKLREL